MVKKSIDAKVRPLANASLEKASLLGAARIYVNKDSIIALTGTLDSGSACIVEKLVVDGPDGAAPSPIRREASLCVLPDKGISLNVVMMSRAFQDATGFKIGDQVRISLAEAPTPDAEEVAVRDISEGSQDDKNTRYAPSWEHSISLSLARAEQVFPGMVLEGVTINKLRRTYKVASVNARDNSLARVKLDSMAIRILQPGDEDGSAAGPAGPAESRGDLVLNNVPGLGAQVKAINAFLRGFTRPFYFPDIESSRSCGFVIHGGHGTGKTFILQRIADTKWGKVHWIKPFDKLTTVREIFKQTLTQQPCMILIDDLEELIAQDRSNRDALIETIGSELDTLADRAREQNALPHVVVLVTCSDYLTDVPQKLQSRSRLFKNITLPIPRAPQRLEILRYHDPPLAPQEKEACLVDLSQRTHAYNCKDLSDLVRNARDIREDIISEAGVDPATEGSEQQHFVTREDIEQALRLTRPTAMHDINLQPPIVHWQDVGGQDSVKKVLSRMIKYAKETDPSVPRVITPSKGLLLYGPPGCSKTLSAQAMATESSFNFFAVKGAELLNMYVGESERAVRNLFNRARAASPSIIFFDEIDSIGGQRGPGGGGSSSAASKSSGAVNMITTLLTEMDGFEALSGVLVIAATNRPESMDEALLRPGRFDEVVYVGPPDQAAREAIFHVHLRDQPLAADVDIPNLAARAEGHSGAEIKNICNKAAHAVQERYDDDETGTAKLEFTMEDLEAALLREPIRITQQMIDGYDRWSRQFRQQ